MKSGNRSRSRTPTKVKRLPSSDADMLQELADKLGLSNAEAYRRYGGRSIERAYRRIVLPEKQLRPGRLNPLPGVSHDPLPA